MDNVLRVFELSTGKERRLEGHTKQLHGAVFTPDGGFRTGDISCWERAWCAYSNVLGAATAKGAVTDLSCWVRAINRHSQRGHGSPFRRPCGSL